MATANEKSILSRSKTLQKNRLIKLIVDQFDLAIIKTNELEISCKNLFSSLNKPISKSEFNQLKLLFPLLEKRTGKCCNPLFDLLRNISLNTNDPVPFVKALFLSRDKELASKALRHALFLAESGRLQIDRMLLIFIAELLNKENSPFCDDHLADISLLVSQYFDDPDLKENQLENIFLKEKNLDLQKLSGRLLDFSEKSIKPELAQKIFGRKFYSYFAPFLEYTRPAHRDLLHLFPVQTIVPALYESFVNTEKILGRKLLLSVVAHIGWARFNLGLFPNKFKSVTVKNSPPYWVNETEAGLLESCGGKKAEGSLFVIISCGGNTAGERSASDLQDPVNRFRAYNLNHAGLLYDFLDMAPLTATKIYAIIERMDKIVEDYVRLFNSFSNECTILPGVYGLLKTYIYTQLDEDKGKPQLSAGLTRLVLSFEDPANLGEVRTLHGLKRYLHQQSLRFGFRLVEGNHSPNRTIDIIIAGEEGIRFVFNKIHFADFETISQEHPFPAIIPFPVQILLDGFIRQMINGQDHFPYVDIFCYGNEVHYYFSFRNHPVFLRIDYAPPLRGGMIDLEYFGVSNYELDHHPNISLDALQLFFKRMEFDLVIEGTHIHARYDKERALYLGDLIKKSRQIFRLTPYLMDLDWIIGSLKLDKHAKSVVIEAWCTFFLQWGYLPLKYLLTKNRSGIIAGYNEEPSGKHEIVWSGEGGYRDLFSDFSEINFYRRLKKTIMDIHPDLLNIEENVKADYGQLELEKWIFIPLKNALNRGELNETPTGLILKSGSIFKRVHEAEQFAEILSGSSVNITAAMRIARILQPMERNITFSVTGNINGYIIQKAELSLRNGVLCFYSLLNKDGQIQLAFYSTDTVLYKKRTGKKSSWTSNASLDVSSLGVLLRTNNFVEQITDTTATDNEKQALLFPEEIKKNLLTVEQPPLPGEQIITGLKASPGRAVGRALFGTENRHPQDFRGFVLVAPSVRPEDTTFLYYTDAVVSTGGGILSHAGLVAMQFAKPALIIPGDWKVETPGQPVLYYNSIEYQLHHHKVNGFNICTRSNIQQKRYTMHEGDLLIVDALSGKIHVLGQERDVMALYEGFRTYREASRMLDTSTLEREILILQGEKLHALHQLKTVLIRCKNPVTARYAIFEILLNEPASGDTMNSHDKGILLKTILTNPDAGDISGYLLQVMNDLTFSLNEALFRAQKDIPIADSTFEILRLRLNLIHQQRIVTATAAVLKDCLIESTLPSYKKSEIDINTIRRLDYIRQKICSDMTSFKSKIDDQFSQRHLLRQTERIYRLLQIEIKPGSEISRLREQLDKMDKESFNAMMDRYVIDHNDCGFELSELVGWKAANLAEIEHLSGRKYVPAWFAVTDKAFQEILNSPVKNAATVDNSADCCRVSLQQSINAVLERNDINNQQKSRMIKGLWEMADIPDYIREPVIASYRRITAASGQNDNKTDPVHVAVRSSSRDEDTETAARAGEFETYLYVNGEEQLLHFLKRTWSGLWTERAIHNRFLHGTFSDRTGGGIIVQRMVHSRVSGVMQTVNIPKGNLREMVINAGLGLGEGIVSGTVAADQVTVSKGIDCEKDALKFSYITSDKTEQIIYNRRAGFGTIRTCALYHQRLRPALEYVELCQLVKVAGELEKVYGYPLDIEFGFEGSRLWLLQVRPVASFLAAYLETLEHFPIQIPEGMLTGTENTPQENDETSFHEL